MEHDRGIGSGSVGRAAAEIQHLRLERDAAILAHSYQPPEIQAVADFVGDSLELSRAAAASPRRVIVICGVRFMAETAYVLAPEKVILNPSPDAGCPLAECMTAEDLEQLGSAWPRALPVVYINSSVELKAGSWACCTSANASLVVSSAPSDEVIFGPDRNLGLFVSRTVSKTMRIFSGGCPPHATASIESVRAAKAEWPDAETLVHPETPPEIWELADHVLGTGGMISRVAASPAARFVIGTEEGMVHRLGVLFPDRSFRAAGGITCPDMKKTTLERVAESLRTLEPRVRIDEAVRAAAHAAVIRMVSIG
jgi:quinolinate synthase